MASITDDIFVHTLAEESEHNTLGFIDLHQVAARTKTEPLKTVDTISLLHKKGYTATRTHFSPHAVKTTATAAEFTKIIQSCGGRQ